MSTIFKRLWSYHKNNNVPVLFDNDRAELGKIVQKEFMKIKSEKEFYYKTESIEYGVVHKVNHYPSHFTKRIDKLILNYYRKIERRNRKLTNQTALHGMQ